LRKPQNLSKCPTIMKKTSIYLEIILKSLEFFKKASHHFKKNLSFIENVFKKPRNLCKSLRIPIEASISLKMSSKSLVIFVKASHV
jgi:hypothetical protein